MPKPRVLLCPAYRFIQARTVTSFARARRLFGRECLDEESLRSSLQSMQARVDGLWREVRTAEDLLRFAQTRANEITLTSPRPIRVGSPREELDALFRELFPRGPSTQRAPEYPELDSIFRRASLVGRVRFDERVIVPVIDRELTAPYAYQNGAINLVRPEAVDGPASAAINRAERLAVEGDLLQKHPGPGGIQRRLIVVLGASGAADEEAPEARVRALLGAYDVRVVVPGDLEAFGREVETSAHAH